MRYAPSDSEYQSVQQWSAAELLEYFLIRIAETEEVWGLHRDGDWFQQDENGQILVSFWPYKQYAREAALEQWHDCTPHGMSLEHLLFPVLPQLIETDVLLDIMPAAGRPGCRITPHRLLDILVGMQHAREYRLDADG